MGKETRLFLAVWKSARLGKKPGFLPPQFFVLYTARTQQNVIKKAFFASEVLFFLDMMIKLCLKMTLNAYLENSVFKAEAIYEATDDTWVTHDDHGYLFYDTGVHCTQPSMRREA